MASEKIPFHNHDHAVEFDRRAAKSDIRTRLTPKLVEALELRGPERVLDLAAGTGRFARPVAEALRGGSVVGLDRALAMLRVAQEQKEKEPIPGFLPVGGNAAAFPFRSEVFDRGFTVFALHHFSRPPLTLREADRVLKKGGRFIVLDPVVPPIEDEKDREVFDRINLILRRRHGDEFHYHSLKDIEDLLAAAGLRVLSAETHSFFIDQEGMEGIPTGRHWLEVAEQLKAEFPALHRRFEEKYFRWEKTAERVHVRGSFGFGLVCGEKR
jgi:ubiquinone/menaquinone biosynthesis C-methylase UbiE